MALFLPLTDIQLLSTSEVFIKFVNYPKKYLFLFSLEFVTPQVLKDYYSISDSLSICNRTDNTQVCFLALLIFFYVK